ncbi:hypothetical protein [Alkanindiges illinoisensis]|uniref:hypothetical protein n=1 Tax=Alkanindiges illinoisensis TaxID=197183 RepID=UPI0006841ED0|nr:hypothetical protein [Alkanindiges illinoisensis]
MNTEFSQLSQKYLISQKDLARKLGMSVDALRKLQKIDPVFAQAMIKMGSTRQAAVFYIVAEILKWIESKKTQNVFNQAIECK